MTMAGKCAVCGDPYHTEHEYRQHAFGSHKPDDFVDEGKEKSTVRVGRLGVVAALAVGIATGYLAFQANNYADEANKFAEESVNYAESSNAWLNWEQTQQYANKVYLGEAPQYFYDAFREHPNAAEAAPVTWVVLNASGVEIQNVWIEGKGDTWIKVDAIQRCTMYSAPHFAGEAEFVPVAVHFSDPISIAGGYVWRRTAKGDIKGNGTPLATKEQADPEDDGESFFALDVTDCSG